MNVAQAPTADSNWSNLTPQQKMGLALLQASQNDTSNYQQNGQYSPMQGMAGMGNALLAAQMMKQGQQPQQDPSMGMLPDAGGGYSQMANFPGLFSGMGSLMGGTP